MSRRGGFTLIELMVALTVSGVVVTAAYQGLATLTDARTRVDESREPVAHAAGARDLLTTWLRNAAQPEGSSAFAEVERPGISDSEMVTFVVSDGGPLYPGPRRIRLWIDSNPVTPRNGLQAEVSPRRGELAAPDTLELEENAGTMTVRYWGSVDGADRWVRTWKPDDRLPRVVEVRLEPVGVTRVGPGGTARFTALQPLLRLPLVVPIALAVW